MGKCDKGLFKARNINEDVYFHTKYVCPDIYLVVDVLIIKSRLDKDDVYYSGGYFLGKNLTPDLILAQLFPEDKRNKSNVTYIDDTPRQLMVKDGFERVYKSGRTSDIAKWIVEEFKKSRDKEVYNQISKYIPPHTLVGKNDEIPGVRNILGKFYLIKHVLDARADLGYAFIKDTIFLHNLHIKVHKNWEAKLMEDISIPLSKKFNFYAENWRDVMRVYDRKLNIQVHNTWNVIDEQTITLKYNKDFTELEASSIVKLDSVFVDPNIAVIFELEYVFKIKAGKARKENVTVSSLNLLISRLVSAIV